MDCRADSKTNKAKWEFQRTVMQVQIQIKLSGNTINERPIFTVYFHKHGDIHRQRVI